MRTFALLVQKLWIFRNYGVSAQTRRSSQCGQRRMGSIFRDFVRTSWMDGKENCYFSKTYRSLPVYLPNCLGQETAKWPLQFSS